MAQRPIACGTKAPDLDASFRPATYWPEDSLRLAILGNVQGEIRRRLILEALESGNPGIPPDGLLQPVLPPDLRDFLGKLHPMLMGGEYLPAYLPTEIEIARVSLKSTTGDVISVRARLEEDTFIHYRVVDEYDTEFSLPYDHSESPLVAKALVKLMDEAGIVLDLLGGGGGMRDFVSVSSNFYPGLDTHYQDRCEAYLDTHCGAEDDDEE